MLGMDIDSINPSFSLTFISQAVLHLLLEVLGWCCDQSNNKNMQNKSTWSRSYDLKLHVNVRSLNPNQQSWEVLFYLWYRNISFQMLSVEHERIHTLNKCWVRRPHIQDKRMRTFVNDASCFQWDRMRTRVTYSLVFHVVWFRWQKWMLQKHISFPEQTFFSILLAHLFLLGNFAVWRLSNCL